MYAGSLSLSSEEAVEVFRRYVFRRSRQSRIITVTAKRIVRELGIGRDPMVLTRLGMVLAELERPGLLEARRSQRPKKYVVTEPGVSWATAG